jgi:PAS domain S-box-containing protein
MSDYRADAALDVKDDPLNFLATVSERIDGFLYRCLNDVGTTLLRMSSGFERMLGRSAGELVLQGLSFSTLIHPEDRQRVVDQIGRAIEANTRWRLSYRLKAANGEYVPVHETGGASADETGAVTRYGVVVDMRSNKAA